MGATRVPKTHDSCFEDVQKRYQNVSRIFEDLKPAGLEAVEIRSGGSLFARELKSSAVTHLKNSAKPPAEESVIDKAASRGTSSLMAHAFPWRVGHDGRDEAAPASLDVPAGSTRSCAT
jgi:hypothetical protein